MSYQIRHKEWGVFQGEFLGLGFWHPMSEQPEQGFLELETLDDAKLCIEYVSKKYDVSYFSIEPYDKETSERLRNETKQSPNSVE